LPHIIRNLPFYDRPTTVDVRGRSVNVKRDQIIVWVSITEKGVSDLHPNTPRVPAILDTGCTHAFVIRERHLQEWAGIHPRYLRRLAATRVYRKTVPQLAANVWLHPNVSGDRDRIADRAPYRLEILPGIAVVPEPESDPRLPLVGLRAVRWNHLRVSVNGDRCRVAIRTRPRFWFFG